MEKWNEKHQHLENHLQTLEERDAKLKQEQLQTKTMRHRSLTTRLASA